MINEIGWVGNLFFILGAILLAKKKIFGWSCQMFGNAYYLAQGLLVETSSLWVLSGILIFINIYMVHINGQRRRNKWINI